MKLETDDGGESRQYINLKEKFSAQQFTMLIRFQYFHEGEQEILLVSG